ASALSDGESEGGGSTAARVCAQRSEYGNTCVTHGFARSCDRGLRVGQVLLEVDIRRMHAHREAAALAVLAQPLTRGNARRQSMREHSRKSTAPACRAG